MTKDEKIIYYNKIEQALGIEHSVLLEGLTRDEILDLIAVKLDKAINEIKGENVEPQYDTLKELAVAIEKNSVTKGLLDVIEANTLIGQNISTDPNKIELSNDLWDLSPLEYDDYIDKEQIYLFFNRTKNSGPVTFKVKGKPEYELLKDGHNQLEDGDLEVDKMYMVKLCSLQVGCSLPTKHWHLIPISNSSEFKTIVTADDLAPQEDTNEINNLFSHPELDSLYTTTLTHTDGTIETLGTEHGVSKTIKLGTWVIAKNTNGNACLDVAVTAGVFTETDENGNVTVTLNDATQTVTIYHGDC